MRRGEPSGGGWLARELGRPHRMAALVSIAGMLALGALAGVASTVGFGRVWRQLLHPHWIWLPIAVGCEIGAYVAYTLAYRELARVEHGPELGMPRAALLVTTGFGVFVQGGGFALDRAALERAGLTQREARARVLGLGSLEYAVLAPATALAALYVLLWHPALDKSLTLPWVIGVPVGAAIALFALSRRNRFRRRGWRMHVYDSLQAIVLLLCLFKRPRNAAVAFISIAVYWLGDIGCLWAALSSTRTRRRSRDCWSATRPGTRSHAGRYRSAAPASWKRCCPSRSAGSGSPASRRCSASPCTGRSTSGYRCCRRWRGSRHCDV